MRPKAGLQKWVTDVGQKRPWECKSSWGTRGHPLEGGGVEGGTPGVDEQLGPGGILHMEAHIPKKRF